jgi:hypothetical protein
MFLAIMGFHFWRMRKMTQRRSVCDPPLPSSAQLSRGAACSTVTLTAQFKLWTPQLHTHQWIQERARRRVGGRPHHKALYIQCMTMMIMIIIMMAYCRCGNAIYIYATSCEPYFGTRSHWHKSRCSLEDELTREYWNRMFTGGWTNQRVLEQNVHWRMN